jgi:hypothetical protein
MSCKINLITFIKANDGNVYNHDHKATIIWESYKGRIGIQENAQMIFQLDRIVRPHDLLTMPPSRLVKLTMWLKISPLA